MKEDNLYLENLAEYVYDEKKFVNYKFLSVKLKVHVNLAKQMLYKFYEREKSEGKKIYAMYYLSGLAPQNWISNLNNGDKEDTSQEGLSECSKESDLYLVMLCKDHELEKFKKRFSRLYSVHVYGLSSFPVNNLDVLNKAAEHFLRDDEGNAAVSYGPITCKAAFEYREDPRLAPLLQNIKEVQLNLVKTKERTEEIENQTREAQGSSVIKETANAKRGAVATAGKKPIDSSTTTADGKDRLKNMFAAAASKPRTKEPEKPQSKKSEAKSVKADECVPSSRNKQFGKWKEVEEDSTKSNHKKVSSRKRKRIRDVFSSSDEEDKKSVQSDSDGLPESPIPSKRNQIESDSEEEIKEVEEPPQEVVSPVKSATVKGRRRVWKRVPKRYVDKNGFLVTEIEQVMVSESDHSDQDEKETTNRSDTKATTLSKTANVEVSHPPVSASKVTATGKDKKSSSNALPVNAKTKQVSIMSFFQKK